MALENHKTLQTKVVFVDVIIINIIITIRN